LPSFGFRSKGEVATHRRHRRQPEEREEARADDVGRRVDGERETRPEPGDEQTAARGTESSADRSADVRPDGAGAGTDIALHGAGD